MNNLTEPVSPIALRSIVVSEFCQLGLDLQVIQELCPSQVFVFSVPTWQ